MRKFVSPVAPSPTKEKDLASLEAQRRLVRALQAALVKLSEAEVTALDRYFQSSSLAQIARRLGTDSRRIYHIHERALTTLRRTLDEFGLCQLDIVLASRTPWEFFLRDPSTTEQQGASECEYSSSSSCSQDAHPAQI